jgi:transcription termination factor Rho
MSIIDRASLQESPLADLHAIASELSIDGYRRFRKEELIEVILRRQGGPDAREPAGAEGGDREDSGPRRRRTRRGGRGRGGAVARDEEPSATSAEESAEATVETEAERSPDEVVEGVVELLPGGAAFLRLDPPEPSDQDVYVSAAQVRRCELVSGDRVSGPRRPPRRSERFPSLIRVDTINGTPASELAESTRFGDLPAAFPSEPFGFDSDDPTIRLIAEQLPIGRGSRVSIVGQR